MEKKTTDTMLLMRGLEARLLMGDLMCFIDKEPNEVIPNGIDGLRLIVEDLKYLVSFCKDSAMQQRFEIVIDHFVRAGKVYKNKGFYDCFINYEFKDEDGKKHKLINDILGLDQPFLQN